MLYFFKPDDAPVTFDPYNEDFRLFAINAHGTQTYGKLPYAFHLAAVENVLTNADYTDYTSRAVAWLHDVIEDTSVTCDSLAEAYGEKIAIYVGACTGVGKTREERNESIYSKLEACPDAAVYKTADRIANMKHGMITGSPKLIGYVREFGEFSARIRPLMVGERKSGLLWSCLENVVADSIKICRKITVAL